MRPGERYRVHAGFDRLDHAAAQNMQAGAHLWTLLVSYGLTDQEAAHATEGVDTLLDADHLLSVSPLGCFICERYYEDVVGKPCAGDPKKGTPP